MFNDNKLDDKRLRYNFIADWSIFAILIAVSLGTLTLNKLSLDDKNEILKAKATVDRTFHLQEVTINHLFNAHMYRNNITLQKIAILQATSDSNKFKI